MHSVQRMFGCDIREDGHSSSFWQFGFDGQDYLSLDLETMSWVLAKPMAVWTKRWWEMERCYAEYNKAYLESLCLTSLHRYLELGGQHLTRRGKVQPVAMQRVAPRSYLKSCPISQRSLGVEADCIPLAQRSPLGPMKANQQSRKRAQTLGPHSR